MHKKVKITDENRTAVVRAHLILKGSNLTALARLMGVTDRWLAYLLRGKRHSARVQRVMADILVVSFEELWGEPPSPQPSPVKGEGDKGETGPGQYVGVAKGMGFK